MRSIFRKIALYFSPKEDAAVQPLHGLTDSDVKELARFRSSEGFDVFTRLLDVHVNIIAEQLLSPHSRDAATLHEIRGVILGLRKAASLVDETVHASVRLADAGRAEREFAAASADARAGALFGTPSWHQR